MCSTINGRHSPSAADSITPSESSHSLVVSSLLLRGTSRDRISIFCCFCEGEVPGGRTDDLGEGDDLGDILLAFGLLDLESGLSSSSSSSSSWRRGEKFNHAKKVHRKKFIESLSDRVHSSILLLHYSPSAVSLFRPYPPPRPLSPYPRISVHADPPSSDSPSVSTTSPLSAP